MVLDKVTLALITDVTWKNFSFSLRTEAAWPVMTEASLLLPFPVSFQLAWYPSTAAFKTHLRSFSGLETQFSCSKHGCKLSRAFVAPEPAWRVICRVFGAGCVDYLCECINEVAGRPVAQWPHSAGFLNCHRKAGKFLIRAFCSIWGNHCCLWKMLCQSGGLKCTYMNFWSSQCPKNIFLKSVLAAL